MAFGDQHKLADEVKVKLDTGDAFHMNDFIQRYVNAIIRQEGMSEDYTNPGNLRAAPWLKNPTIEKNFWIPTSRKQGIAGIAHVVALHIAEGNTHRQLISIWAPPSDNNNTEAYIKNVADWVCIPDYDQPLSNYLL